MSDNDEAIDWYYDGLVRYVGTLEAWFAAEQERAFNEAVIPDGQWHLCLGLLVYGSYVDRFLELGMPSLLAPGNLSSLSNPLVIIHTDQDSVDKLVEGTLPLCKVARVEIRIIPDTLVEQVGDNPANKYWMLGAAHNIHMHQAKYRAHAYHMLMPDHVYATGYFENLQRLAKSGIQAIVQNNISAKMEDVEPYLKTNNCVIGPSELTKLAIDNMHPQVYPFLLNGREDLPASLLVVMLGEKAAHIMCPHMSIVYLSHDVLMKTYPRIPNTIDGQLPFFIPEDVEPYVPSAEDGMIYIEISDKDKPAHFKNEGSTLEQFCVKFWATGFCVRGYERFFGLTTVMPYPEGYKPNYKLLTDKEIEATKVNLRAAINLNYDKIYQLLPENYRQDPIEAVKKLKGIT